MTRLLAGPVAAALLLASSASAQVAAPVPVDSAPVSPAPTATPAAAAAPAPTPAPAATPAPPPPVTYAPPPAPPPAPVAAAPAPAPSKRKPIYTSFSLGGGTSGGDTYWVAGLGLGYPLALGLRAEVRGDYWFGSSPNLGKVAPGLTWYLPIPFSPYLGAYYAHWFVGGAAKDQDALGGRAGLTLSRIGPASLSVGVSYEKAMDCQYSCESWMPEVMAGVAF